MLYLAMLHVQLGDCLLRQEKFAEAEPFWREALSIREKKFPDDWRTFNTRAMLGSALLGQSKFADAEHMLVAGYEGMKQHEAKIPPEHRRLIVTAVERLVHLYDAWDKQDEAARWRRTLDELQSSAIGVRPPEPDGGE
jgi:hypothetical protein